MKKFLSILTATLMFCLTTVGLADRSIAVDFTDSNGQSISSLSAAGTFYIKITALYNNTVLTFDQQTPLYPNQLPAGVSFANIPLANCLSGSYNAGQSCIVQFNFSPTVHDSSTETVNINVRNAHISPAPAYTSAIMTLHNN
ncbi:MAG: hypothetical protein K5Q00_04445 [Gammaproteobacteria bacterium]|nr:hypothetical protein [Gammaproteobacteria bacterium]